MKLTDIEAARQLGVALTNARNDLAAFQKSSSTSFAATVQVNEDYGQIRGTTVLAEIPRAEVINAAMNEVLRLLRELVALGVEPDEHVCIEDTPERLVYATRPIAIA